MNKNIKNSKIEYKFKNKTYTTVPELSKGSCVGCAFMNKIDCYKYQDRLDICQNNHVIFARKYNSLDK